MYFTVVKLNNKTNKTKKYFRRILNKEILSSGLNTDALRSKTMAKALKKNIPDVGVRGRPTSTPLEKARREALKARRLLEKANSEFNERMASDDGSDPARSNEIRQMADLRMKLAAGVNDARKLVSQARADKAKKSPGAAARLSAAKANEKKAYEAFRELPDLGFTQEEWDDPEVRKRELGRPQLDVEIKRVRAQEDLKEAMEKVKAEEVAAGEKHVPLAKLVDPVKSSKGKGLGRPKLDKLGRLDRRLVTLEKKIEQIESEPEIQESAFSSGKGRRPKTKRAKLIEARTEAKEIKEMISAEEQKLDPVGRINRTLKKLRDERRRMTLAIRDNPDNCEAEKIRREFLGETIDERMAELQLLEQEMAENKELQADQEENRFEWKKETAHQVKQEDDGRAPADVLENINPSTAAARPSSQGGQPHAANLNKRRAEAMRQASMIDQKYAQWIDKLYEDYPEDAASAMAAPLEARRKEERKMIEGIELIS